MLTSCYRMLERDFIYIRSRKKKHLKKSERIATNNKNIRDVETIDKLFRYWGENIL